MGNSFLYRNEPEHYRLEATLRFTTALDFAVSCFYDNE